MTDISLHSNEKGAAAPFSQRDIPCIQMKNVSQYIFSDSSRVSECLWVQVAFLNAYVYEVA